MAVAVARTANFKFPLPPLDKKLWQDDFIEFAKATDALMARFFTLKTYQGAWKNSTAYASGDNVLDVDQDAIYTALVPHTSSSGSVTFLTDRTNNPTFWQIDLSTSAETLRGEWVTATAYSLRDFVTFTPGTGGGIYAVCIAPHTSGADFLTDSINWTYLVDTRADVVAAANSAAAAAVSAAAAVVSAATIPTLVGNSLKMIRVDAGETTYEVRTAAEIVTDLAVPGLGLSNVFTASNTIQLTDNSASRGPTFTLKRSSSSPLALDQLGIFKWEGRNDADQPVEVANIFAQWLDPADSTEDAALIVQTIVAGVRANMAVFAAGMQLGSPIGGDQGAGTLNAVGVFDDGSILSPYVFEAYRTGIVDMSALDDKVPNREIRDVKGELVRIDVRVHEPARRFVANRHQELDPANYCREWKLSGHLPNFPSEAEWTVKGNFSTGDLIQRCMEAIELSAVHTDVLLQRIEALEAL